MGYRDKGQGEAMRVYMCYADQDRVFAEDLMSVLIDRGFLLARRDPRKSDEHWQMAIQRSFVLVYVLSHAAARTTICTQQWRYAVDYGRRVIIIKLDEVEIPAELHRMNLIDYLDFEEIGRQLNEGQPALRRERYATEVSLRMLIAEIAEAKEIHESGEKRSTLAQRVIRPVELEHDSLRRDIGDEEEDTLILAPQDFEFDPERYADTKPISLSAEELAGLDNSSLSDAPTELTTQRPNTDEIHAPRLHDPNSLDDNADDETLPLPIYKNPGEQ